MPLTASRKAELTEKIESGQRLSYQDGVALYDVRRPGLARRARPRRAHRARTATRVLQRQPAPEPDERLLARRCAYCSFQRKPGEKDAYTMRIEEAVEQGQGDGGRAAHRAAHRQRPAPDAAVEVLPAGAARAEGGAARASTLKAFTATEIHWFEKISGLTADEILDELIDAGLESLTGGGAEIFDWEVRQQIVDHDTPLGGLVAHPPAGPQQGPARRRPPCSTATSRSRGTASTTCCGCASCRTRPAASQVFIPLRYQHDFVDTTTARSATGCRRAPRWPAGRVAEDVRRVPADARQLRRTSSASG